MRTGIRNGVGQTILNLLLLVFAVLLFAFASAVAQVLVQPDAAAPTRDSRAASDPRPARVDELFETRLRSDR
jgi:hypothetical protein